MTQPSVLARNWRPLVAALVSVCLWSSAFVGIRAATRTISPGSLALGRLLIGSILLGIPLLRRGLTRPARRELALLAIAGLLWFGLYNAPLNTPGPTLPAGAPPMVLKLPPPFLPPPSPVSPPPP